MAEAITARTTFETCRFCKAQKRGSRPNFGSNRSHSRREFLTIGGGSQSKIKKPLYNFRVTLKSKINQEIPDSTNDNQHSKVDYCEVQ